MSKRFLCMGFLWVLGLSTACTPQNETVSEIPQNTPIATNTLTSTPGAVPTLTASLQPEPSLEATIGPAITPQPTSLAWFDFVMVGGQGADNALYDRPTGLAAAADGTLYVAAAGQSYIFHIDRHGQVLGTWGGYQPAPEGEKAAPGTFNQIAGLALGLDDSLYAADLWNHRIQKFTLEGEFLLEWGEFGSGNDPYQFWGPRGIAVDAAGRVLVTDTGNKRVVVYDSNGQFVSQIGGEGTGPGQFNEPVGIAVDGEGMVYVADAWNRRIQVLSIDTAGILTPLSSWDVDGWYSQEEDFKPYLCVVGDIIYTTDPNYGLVLAYSAQGENITTYTLRQAIGYDYGVPTGIAADPDGGLWVSDLWNRMLIHISP